MTVWPEDAVEYTWTPDPDEPERLSEREFAVFARSETDAVRTGLIHVWLLLTGRS